MTKQLLTNADMTIMNDYNYRYGSGADEIPTFVFDFWQKGKEKHLFKLFGDKLIVEKEIEYGLAIDDYVDELRSNEKFREFNELIRKSYLTYPQVKLQEKCADDQHRVNSLLYCLTTCENLIGNKLTENYDFKIGDRRFKFQSGAKAFKVFQKVLTALDFENMALFEEVRNIVSQITQKTKITKGTLCLSIHPMDFFTMSDNENNWSSCMSWTEDGGHREGTIGCLGGEDCIVAYIKSEKDMTIVDEGSTWNNKLWRQLVAVNKDGIVTNRHYPHTRPDIEEKVVEMIKEMAKEAYGVEYGAAETYNWGKVITLMGSMYSDVNANNSHIYFATTRDTAEKLKVEFANDGICFECGGLLEEGSGDLVCHGCKGDFWCECCEEWVCGEEHHTADGIVCDYCLDEYYSWCDHCEEYHYRDNGTYIEHLEMTVCEYCLENHYEYCEECEQFYPVDDLNVIEDREGRFCDRCKERIEEEQALSQEE